jgi:hypothetical protein
VLPGPPPPVPDPVVSPLAPEPWPGLLLSADEQAASSDANAMLVTETLIVNDREGSLVRFDILDGILPDLTRTQ